MPAMAAASRAVSLAVAGSRVVVVAGGTVDDVVELAGTEDVAPSAEAWDTDLAWPPDRITTITLAVATTAMAVPVTISGRRRRVIRVPTIRDAVAPPASSTVHSMTHADRF